MVVDYIWVPDVYQQDQNMIIVVETIHSAGLQFLVTVLRGIVLISS